MKTSKDTNTEQAIIEVAERLFLEKGFALTSTTEIAKEVGCNQALVHYYFRTKDKLFEAIFEKKIRMFVSAFIKKQEEIFLFKEKLTIIKNLIFEYLSKSKIPFLFFMNYNKPERLCFKKTKY
jgi:AcrR family transcriptional regulator